MNEPTLGTVRQAIELYNYLSCTQQYHVGYFWTLDDVRAAHPTYGDPMRSSYRTRYVDMAFLEIGGRRAWYCIERPLRFMLPAS